jgi:hypothetical protein
MIQTTMSEYQQHLTKLFRRPHNKTRRRTHVSQEFIELHMYCDAHVLNPSTKSLCLADLSRPPKHQGHHAKEKLAVAGR